MSDFDIPEDMTHTERVDTHGTQLRMATDVLEGVAAELDYDARFAVIAAEDLLTDIIVARMK